MKISDNLFKASNYDGICGVDPIVFGVNLARLDIDKSVVLDGYTERYGEEFFEEFIDGYDHAFDDEFVSRLTPARIPYINHERIFNVVIENSRSIDCRFNDAVANVERLSTSVISEMSTMGAHIRYPMMFKITLRKRINGDGSCSIVWRVDTEVTHSLSIQRFDFTRRIEIGPAVWHGSNNVQGTHRTSYWYELSAANEFSPTAAVNLIETLVGRCVVRYGLSPSRINDQSKLIGLNNMPFPAHWFS